MDYEVIKDLINDTYEHLNLLEERRVGEFYYKVSKGDNGSFEKNKKKVCSIGMKWSSSRNSCVKMSAKEKIGRKKGSQKTSRTLRATLKGSKLLARNRKAKRTMKARKSLVVKRSREV